jgi:hypothetical protein
VGPRAGLDRFGKSRPHRDSIPVGVDVIVVVVVVVVVVIVVVAAALVLILTAICTRKLVRFRFLAVIYSPLHNLGKPAGRDDIFMTSLPPLTETLLIAVR